MTDWNTLLKEIMDRTEFMAVATSGVDGQWVCPVQFSYDSHLNLYFKSMPGSKHMQNLLHSPDVAIAIFSTNRFPHEDVAGLQIKGRAQILSDRSEVENAARYHYGRSQPELDYRTKVDEHLGEKAEWNFVKVVPTEVWCFDTRHFDEVRQ
ncbi:MAG: pyridoxamine 5'-phosphate oxidase family protein, partial [Patescibacteria group bacterium]